MKIKVKNREFKIGDRVRIKSLEEIKRTLNSSGRTEEGIYLNQGMHSILDGYDTIKETFIYNQKECYYLTDRNWAWSSEWLEHEN